MTQQELYTRLNHPAINKSWFARKFYGIDEKYNYKINTFLDRLRGGKGSKFTKEEIKKMETIFKEFIIELI